MEEVKYAFEKIKARAPSWRSNLTFATLAKAYQARVGQAERDSTLAPRAHPVACEQGLVGRARHPVSSSGP